MEKSVNIFDYAPLLADGSQIRLVIVDFNNIDDMVECHLNTYDFRKGSTGSLYYEALSYVWGDATVTLPIRLNIQSFQVTTNLEAALRGLRDRKEQWPIWIDAICINQSSVKERNQEVCRMGQIYRYAACVVIWLDREVKSRHGFPSKDPDRSLHAGEETYTLLKSLAKADARDPDDAAKIMSRTDDQMYSLQLLSWLFDHPWFSRIWIIQEIALAKNAVVGYGGRWLEWNRVVEAVNALSRSQLGWNSHLWGLSNANRAEKLQRCCDRVLLVGKQRHQPTKHEQLVDLLWQTRFFAMTDPRDRLFALLGLISGDITDENQIKINYTKPIADVFLELSIFLIRGGWLSHVLCAITNPSHGLPSWATDWTALVGDLRITNSKSSIVVAGASRLSSGIIAYMQSHHLRGFEQPYVFSISPDSRELTLRAAILDDFRIQYVGQRFEAMGFEDLDIYKRLHLWQKRLNQWESDMERQKCSRVHFKTPTERRDAWKQALLHELPPDQKALSLHLSQEASAMQTMLSVAYDLLTKPAGELPKNDALGMRMNSLLTGGLGMNAEYRRPFVTKMGLMGSTSTNCDLRQQDVICIFEDSAVPYVLRPWGRLQGQYKFISCCWIPTLMNMDMVREKPGEMSRYADIITLI